MTEKKRTYLRICDARLLNIKVFLDDKLVYEGKVENAPLEIGRLKYSKVEMQNTITYFAYSELN